jgi:hypothetical protein
VCAPVLRRCTRRAGLFAGRVLQKDSKLIAFQIVQGGDGPLPIHGVVSGWQRQARGGTGRQSSGARRLLGQVCLLSSPSLLPSCGGAVRGLPLQN